MDLGIKGKRALVQGGSAGLGKAIARALVAEGVRVALCSRDQARAQAAAKDVGAEWGFACDVGTAQGGERSVLEASQRLGGIDILVVNTGGPPKGAFSDLTERQWRDGFESLWLSAVTSMKSALEGMKAQKWGRILIVTSAAAKEPMPGLNISNGLRAGLLGLTKSISNEVAGDGVTINALLPGYTDTERLRELQIPQEKIAGMVPARRLGKPEELAALSAFLASEPAAYITGQMIACDGGWMRGH